MNRLEELARLKQAYKEHQRITYEMAIHNIDPRIIKERNKAGKELRRSIKDLKRLN